MAFKDRVAVITGAGGNIGRELCRQFGLEGVKVAATDVSLSAVQKVADEMCALGYCVKAYEQDVTSSESVKASFAQIFADFGKVDILINNAGVWIGHLMETKAEDEWLRILHINLEGTFRCMQQVLPGMIERRYGRIVNLGSIAGVCGLPGHADYSAAKAGVIMLTKVAAMENAKRGITVNSVSPGMVAVGEPCDNKGTWLGRSGAASEIVRAIVFLADDGSGYITGVDIPVDGGRVLGPHNSDVRADGTFA
ncbi:MAG: SDR family NAD(P)-dependent oxidoreductase [Victivallales bacterium]|nr:SDR family NAD(P)-dependent oxidoreductase [Victivallales bacterium]